MRPTLSLTLMIFLIVGCTNSFVQQSIHKVSAPHPLYGNTELALFENIPVVNLGDHL